MMQKRVESGPLAPVTKTLSVSNIERPSVAQILQDIDSVLRQDYDEPEEYVEFCTVCGKIGCRGGPQGRMRAGDDR